MNKKIGMINDIQPLESRPTIIHKTIHNRVKVTTKLLS